MMNKTGQRTCIVCKSQKDKSNLMRWSALNSTIYLDWRQMLDGRSVYTCPEKACVEALYKLKKMPGKFLTGSFSFALEKENIFDQIVKLSKESLSHFLSLSIKSNALLRGQNIVLEYLKKSPEKLKAVIVADDISDKLQQKVKRYCDGVIPDYLFSTKAVLGEMLKTRPVGVLAVSNEELADKISYYIEIINNFEIKQES